MPDLSEQRTDHELLAAHVAGDPDAFAVIFQRHADRLWSVALRTAGCPEDASDALQDAMISAYRRAGSFRGDAAVTTWLHRIVVNACLDLHRKRRNRPSTTWIETLHDQVDDGEDPIVNRELRLELERALARLPEDQRAAIVLVDVEGYSVAETAQILDCPVGTVKSRCSRGRARLAEDLAQLRNYSETSSVQTEKPGGDRA